MTATLNPPPIPGFSLGHPEVTPRLPFSAAMPTERLDEKYRPATLAEVKGQEAVVAQLATFLAAPTSTAFLFEGASGVGKTSAARALANDLGVDRDWGFELIESARGDMEAVDRALRMLRHVAPGSGWKLVLVDEADLMTPRAAHLWLSALESLPARSVVVFTTNRPDHFPDRFLDRCERLRFESDGRTLKRDAQAIVDRVWSEETGMDDAPSVDDLPNLVDANGTISFRRAVMALAPLLRARQRPPMPAGRPTVAYGPVRPIDRPEPPSTATDRPADLLDAPRAVAPSKPARTPRARPATPPAAQPQPAPATLSAGAELARRRAEAAEAEMRRIEGLSAENAERIRIARDDVESAGKRATPALRAELKAAEAEDARLVKLWLAAQAERARALRDAKRAETR